MIEVRWVNFGQKLKRKLTDVSWYLSHIDDNKSAPISVRESPTYAKKIPLQLNRSLPRVENATTKKDVEYLPALTRCGKTCLVSLKRRKHCTNRHQAGRQATKGRIPYSVPSHIMSLPIKQLQISWLSLETRKKPAHVMFDADSKKKGE